MVTRPLVPGTFRSALIVEKLDARRWRVLEPLVFDSLSLGRYVVPAGFVTDFSSVPRWPILWWLFGGVADEPAVLHDHGYATQTKARWVIDRLFFEAMGDDGTPPWKRRLMWAGVRLFGGLAWWHDGRARRRAR